MRQEEDKYNHDHDTYLCNISALRHFLTEYWGLVSVSREYVELEEQKVFMDEMVFEVRL